MRILLLLIALWCGITSAQSDAPAERVCQTPDCLRVENLHSTNGLVKSIGILDTRMHLYVWVPQSTRDWTLEVFDQTDDTIHAKASQFELYAPDGTLERTLDAPTSKSWASYRVENGGRWGVWRLSVTGPQDLEKSKASNAFMVRTRGAVELYLRPEPVARVRGLRLSAPQFGGVAAHQFALQNGDAKGLTFNFLHDAPDGPRLELDAPGARKTTFTLDHQNDDRLRAGTALENIEFSGLDAPALLPLRVENVRGTYGLGLDSGARLFFNPLPLLQPRRIAIETRDSNGQPLAARIALNSPQTANEENVVFTNATGRTEFWALPGVAYRAFATRGIAFAPQSSHVAADAKIVALTLARLWPVQPGWFGGDSHSHSAFYDGTHTPRQMVEAAQAAGLDWFVLSEHAHSEKLARATRANAEAATSAGADLTVIPGMEITGPQFHSNILGALVPIKSGATLAELVATVRAADTPATPIAVKLNHPSLGKTAAQIARETPELSLLELWNSHEPEATNLWFEMLNRGQKIWAETAADSHHRINVEPGSRRTLVFLGDEKPSGAAIVRALREGRSVLSRGAMLVFRVNGARPGATLSATKKTVDVTVESWSARPIESIEIVAGGEVVHRFEVGGKAHFSGQMNLPARAGWMLARVIERGETQPLAMSNPIWIETTQP